MNNRKPLWYVVLVSTDEEKEEMIFVISADRKTNAKEDAVTLYKKKYSEAEGPELLVTILYTTRNYREADIYYNGFLAGRME